MKSRSSAASSRASCLGAQYATSLDSPQRAGAARTAASATEGWLVRVSSTTAVSTRCPRIFTMKSIRPRCSRRPSARIVPRSCVRKTLKDGSTGSRRSRLSGYSRALFRSGPVVSRLRAASTTPKSKGRRQLMPAQEARGVAGGRLKARPGVCMIFSTFPESRTGTCPAHSTTVRAAPPLDQGRPYPVGRTQYNSPGPRHGRRP